MDYWVLLPAGVVIATTASMLGIGGGIVWMPFLLLVMKFNPKESLQLSFAIQAVGMASATLMYLRNKMIFWRLALILAPFIFVGMVAGSYLSQRVAAAGDVELALGVFSMTIAIFFAFQRESYHTALAQDNKITPPWWLRGFSFLIGGVSGFLSTGIGDVLIPTLRTRMKVAMQNAVGTALLLNFFAAMTGSVSHLFLAQELPRDFFTAFGYAAVGVFIGGQLGSYLSQKVDDYRLKELFIFLLMIIGLHMIYEAL